MKKIDLTELNVGVKIDFLKMQKDTFIDVKKDLPRPPSAISIGDVCYGNERFECPFGTYGNFSVITGESKSKKTFAKSLIVASYIGGNSTSYAPNIRTHRTSDKFVLDFDTEQSEWHSQRAFKRIDRITKWKHDTGELYEFYKPYYLRKYNYKERVQFIEWCILESEYKGNVGFVNIDGFADLVADKNDLISSNILVDKLLKWTDISKCHITGIMHTNPASNKPAGHLGTVLMQKSETTCVLKINEGNPNYTDVTFPLTRNFPIDPFSFTIDEYQLPIVRNLEIY